MFPWRRETRHLIRLKRQAGIITDEMAELRYAYHDAAHDHDLAKMEELEARMIAESQRI